MDWRDRLGGRSLEFVISNKYPEKIIAGPGTGKTWSIKRKVARFLSEGVNPKRILIVTFTRMAATDVIREIRNLSISNIDDVDIRTLHSLCFSLLIKADIFNFLNRFPRPIQDFEERFLLEDLKFCDPEFEEDFYPRKDRLKGFKAAWAREQDQIPGWPKVEIDRDFHRRLIKWLRFHEVIFLDELISLISTYLRQNPQAGEFSKYDYIVVDEYQDLNKSEQTFIELISRDANLVVVGDEDQSIYEHLKHAHPEGIIRFPGNNKSIEKFDFEDCYRCPKEIISAANNLIRNNSMRLNHKLIPARDKESEIFCVQWQTPDEEVLGIADYVTYLVNSKNISPGEIIILMPRKEFGYRLCEVLCQRGIFSKTFFNDKILKGNPKKDGKHDNQKSFSLLLLLSSPRDKVALRCWLGYGEDDLGSYEYSKLINYCLKNGGHPRDNLDSVIRGEIKIDGINKIIERYKELILIEEKISGLSTREIIEFVFPASDEWTKPFRSITDTLLNLDIVQVKENLLDAIIHPEIPLDVDYLRIMSLFKSKGLDSKYVIITGCIEGWIPSYPRNLSTLTTIEQNQFFELQRRIFYVAITRTSFSLLISSFKYLDLEIAHRSGAKFRPIPGNSQYGSVITSSLLNELGPNFLIMNPGADFLDKVTS